jgi:hypothetical protein
VHYAARFGFIERVEQMAKKTKRTTQKRKKWTTADISALKKFSREKLPVVKIEKMMKRTAGTLRQKAFALGISLGHQRRKKKR